MVSQSHLPNPLIAPGGFAPLRRRAKTNNPTRKVNMTSKTLIAGAAIAGLMSGASAMQAHAAKISTKAGVLLQQDASKKDKHACQGQNSCKGKGGCKTGDNGCKAKNSCKGKGGCATDGSKPAPSPS
jgi:hypothetical protein